MAQGTGRPRVLAVGIGPDVSEKLREEGYHVEAVETTEDCLATLRDDDVDAVVCAHDLPDSDALALVSRVRALESEMPFVVYTDGGSERLAGDLVAAGASGYVTPEDGPGVLVDRLGAALEGVDGAGAEVTDRYRQLVETSPVAINLFDADGETVYGNDAVLDLLGLDDRDELVGRSIFEFVHPDHRDVASEEHHAVIEEKRSVGPTRMDLRRPDGEVRHVQIATAPGRYHGEDVGQAVAVDVTPLREAQEALEAERQFIDDALDALPDVFYFISADGELERWNETAVEVSGFDENDFASMDVADVFVDEDVERVQDAIATVVSTGDASVEARVETADGRAIPYEFRGRRLTEDDGTVRGVVGIGRDVSERMTMTKQLRTIDRVLRHNLRNALTTIGGRAETIAEHSEGEVAEAASIVVEKSDALLATANKERDVVHLLSERPDPVTVDVVGLVETVARAVRERHPQATVETTLPERAEALAVTALSEAILELLENAIEHCDAKEPTVAVAVEHTDGTVAIRVSDEGPSIPRMEIEAIDEIYGERDQLTHGRGVGLWLVELVVRRSKGTITFADNDPRGNVVTIELDAASDQADRPSVVGGNLNG